MFLDAVYLSGYAPECALKAIILGGVPTARRSQFVEREFRGSVAHNFDHLMHLLRMHRMKIPSEVREAVVRINFWSPDLRYQTGLGDADDATMFLDASRTILEWAERSA